jgi:hypothetical protein
MDVLAELGNEAPVVARRREAEDRENARPGGCGFSNPLAVLETATRRRFPTPEVRLDLDQDNRAGCR